MRLSIVMPAYNEQATIEDAIREIETSVLSVIPECEIIVVNDGSKDNTGALLDQLAATRDSLKVIHQENSGHGAALRSALDAAQGDFSLLIDSDRQIPLDEFGKYWSQAMTVDGVFGVRVARQDPAIRRVLSALIRNVGWMAFGVKLQDPNVPFKIIRSELWKDAREAIPAGTLAPSLFLAYYLKRSGRHILELPVAHRERQGGVVSISRLKLVRFCARGFWQLMAFRARCSRISRKSN